MLRLLEKVAVCKPGREPSPETTLCWNLDHGLPSLQGFEKIHFCRLSPESTALCYGSRGDRHIARWSQVTSLRPFLFSSALWLHGSLARLRVGTPRALTPTVAWYPWRAPVYSLCPSPRAGRCRATNSIKKGVTNSLIVVCQWTWGKIITHFIQLVPGGVYL